MPPTPARAAAYTRTGILRRFLDLLSDTLPSRVDARFAQERLGLKGGDVRAFLQSLRVLGLIDAYGALTERARRTRAVTQRREAMREALAGAYPELLERWREGPGMSRAEVEDFFKLEYGLSASTSGPAAKLFCDLMQEFHDTPAAGAPPSYRSRDEEPPVASPPRPSPPPRAAAERETDARVAALETIKSSLHIDINADWDPDRIELVFDRMERLVDRILRAGNG